jgi:hypothetical protein
MYREHLLTICRDRPSGLSTPSDRFKNLSLHLGFQGAQHPPWPQAGQYPRLRAGVPGKIEDFVGFIGIVLGRQVKNRISATASLFPTRSNQKEDRMNSMLRLRIAVVFSNGIGGGHSGIYQTVYKEIV